MASKPLRLSDIKAELVPPLVYIEERYPEGASVYRSLARQLYGNPDAHEDIQRAVQDHFIRAYIDPECQYHKPYNAFEGRFRQSRPGTASSFLGALQCPDLVLCPCATKKPNGANLAGNILYIMSKALSARIKLSTHINSQVAVGETFSSELSKVAPENSRAHINVGFGEHYGRICYIKCYEDPKINFDCKHSFASGLEDYSGNALIEKIWEERRNQNASIKEISWWPKDSGKKISSYEDLRCKNEWRPATENDGPQLHPLDPAHLRGLSVYTVSINEPSEIRPALKLMDSLLEAAPISKQALWDPTRHYADTSFRRFKKYVTVDAEFAKVRLPKDKQSLAWEEHKKKMRDAYPEVQIKHVVADFGKESIWRKSDLTEVALFKAAPEEERGQPGIYQAKLEEFAQNSGQFMFDEKWTLWRRMGGETEIENGSEEQLVSVLTIAIDRHIVFSFYLLDMLQHIQDLSTEEGAEPMTDVIPNIEYLYEHVIFNQDLVKVWFRYTTDFRVLNATIATMYQATQRPRYEAIAPWEGDLNGWIIPTFKLKSQWLNRHRPSHLEFSKDTNYECDFHGSTEKRFLTNDQGYMCPCQFGNIDIVTLLPVICRGFGHEIEKRPWYDPQMSRFSYNKLQRALLAGSEIFDLLDQLKNAPEVYLRERQAAGIQFASKEDFFKTLKPGMEIDDRKMGYNIGDVVGLALMMRMLTTSDDRIFLSSALAAFKNEERAEEPDFHDFYPKRTLSSSRSEPYPPLPKPLRKFSPLAAGLKRPLIDDFPRVSYRARSEYFSRSALGLLPTAEPYIPWDNLSYFDQDESSLAVMKAFADLESESQAARTAMSQAAAATEGARRALAYYWDPTRIYWPDVLVEDFSEKFVKNRTDQPDFTGQTLRQQDLNEFVFRIRNHSWAKERIWEIPGLARPACPNDVLHWVEKGVPTAGATLNGVDVAQINPALLISPPSNMNDIHLGQEFRQYLMDRIAKSIVLTSYPPPKLPGRFSGEEMVFLDAEYTDSNRDRGVEPTVIPPVRIPTGPRNMGRRVRRIPPVETYENLRVGKRTASEMESDDGVGAQSRRVRPAPERSTKVDNTIQEADPDYLPSPRASDRDTAMEDQEKQCVLKGKPDSVPNFEADSDFHPWWKPMSLDQANAILHGFPYTRPADQDPIGTGSSQIRSTETVFGVMATTHPSLDRQSSPSRPLSIIDLGWTKEELQQIADLTPQDK